MPQKIWRQELLDLLKAEPVQPVEVLPEEEYQELHLPGAVNIPLKDLDRQAVSSLNRDQPVVVY